MKITKEPHRLAEATANVRLLLARITEASDDELPELLDGISEWCWPRGDLHYWSGTLNRFDDILDETVRDYDLRRLQINDFTPKRKLLLVSLLRFSRLLLENCTNRKLYNSFEHLDALLFTSDLDVFEATLRLVLRPAQHFSTQGGVRHSRNAFAISPERLATLAVTWAPREHGFELVDLVKPDAQVPAEMLNVRFQFYKRARAAEGPAVAGPSRAAETSATSAAEASTPVRPRAGRDGRASAMASTSAAAGLLVSSTAATPAGASSVGQAAQQPAEGMTTVDLGYLGDSTRRPMDVLADAIEQHGIPAEDHFELFQKIRLAMSLRDPGARRQLVTCRLLAMACYAHTTSEATASTQLFLYEPEVVQRLTALVDPDQRVGPDVQSGAFYALDALGRYRGKFNDVLNAVNASINHGILLHCLRDLVDALGRPKAAQPDGVLIDALFGFIGFVTSTNVGSNMVVSAGLLPLLIQLLEETKPETYLLQRTVTRAIGLIHSVIYAYQPSFALFVAAKGIDVFVARIEQEIDRDLDVGAVDKALESGTLTEASADSLYGRLSFGRAQLLRALLKTTLHMMSAPGTADGLRNLIDSTLLLSVKRIMQNRVVFGGQVLAIAVNVMATFVHNEPTSLGIVQEKGLPEAFLDMIDADIEANFDVIAAIPNAVGALCLNQAGIQMLNERPVVPKLFALFTSERHTKVLADRENASLFGSGIDELVRHQPGLKQSVLECILSTLAAIYAAGEAYELRDSDKKRMYKLQTVPPAAASDEVMQEAAPGAASASQPTADQAAQSLSVALADVVMDEPDMSLESRDDSGSDNTIVSYIDVMSRFLDGLFQTVQHCKDFLKADGLERLLRFYRLPCLPYDFVNSMGNDSLVTLIRLIVEVSPQSVLSAILRELRTSMTECNDLWGADAPSLASLLSPESDEAAEAATKTFRRLVRLNAHSHLLADVGPTFVFAGAKLPLVFLQTVNSASSPTGRELASIAEIGELQRQAAWQNVCLKAVAPPAERRKPRRFGRGARAAEASAAGADTPSGANETSETDLQKVQSLQGAQSQGSDGADPGPLTCNSTALRYVAASLPSALTTFLIETTRLFVLRRSSDQSLRRHATTTAAAIAGVVTKSLAWPDSDQTQNSFAYACAMVGQATSLLYDDRAGAHPTTNTLVLIAFVREGGLEALLALYTRYNDEITRHFDEDGKVREVGVHDGLRLGHIYSGLGACLKMLHLLSAQRTLMDPSATAILTSKDDADRRAADFFLPHEFLVRLRLAILPALRLTWDAKWLPNAPFTLNRSVNQTMLQILLGEGEAPAPRRETAGSGAAAANSSHAQPDSVRQISSISAALAGLTGALGGAPPGGRGHGHDFAQPRSRLAVQPDENRTRELTDMGFPRAAARAALTRCNNNLALAADYLLSHPEIVANPGPEIELPPSDNQSEAPSEAAAPAVPDAPAAAPAEGAAGVPVAAPPAAAASADGDTQMTDSAARAGASEDEGSHSSDDGDASSAEATRKAANDAALTKVKDEKERLDKLRKDIGETLAPRIIALADQHEGLVFDAKVAFSIVATDAATTVETINSLLAQLDVPRDEAFGSGEKRIAIRLRILALFLNDAVTMKRLHKDSAKAIMLKLGQLAQDYDSRASADSHPAWLAPTLLVACSVLGLDENPAEATISQEEDPAKLEAAGRAPVLEARQFADESRVLFKLAMHCLEHASSLSRGDLLAVYRLLVILTRRHDVAAEFVRSGGVPALFKPFSTLSTKTVSGCQALVVLVLRQVIEDSATLRASMEQEMRAWLSIARQKVVDTSSLTRNLSNVMLRDPDMFMALAQEHLEMVDLVPAKSQGMLRLKSRDETQPGAAEEEDDHQAPPSPSKAGVPAIGADLDLPMNEATDAKDAASTSAPSAELDATMNFLLSELLKATREQAAAASKKASEAQAKSPSLTLQPLEQAPGGTNADQPAPSAAEQEQGDEAADTQYFYTCFLMQCLAELLSSYVSAKTCFVNFSRKRRDVGTPAAKGKATQPLLGFFLSELVPIGFLRSTEHTEMRKLMAQSNWAMSVLVALAADVTVHPDLKQVAPELVAVRKQLLDGIAKAIKDASTASEPVEVRYGRLYALADLCYRLLTARPNHNPAAGGARPAEDLALHMAKTMLEKNFVGVLTSALADVDLNLPMVKSLLDRILKPLEHLTKVAIKMGKAERKSAAASAPAAAALRNASDSASESYDSMDEDGESDHSSDDDEGHAREETPDFYRNSALGMHASENFVEQPGSDEDSEDDEMDMEMEYDSDEDGSDMSADEEDEEMEGVVEIIEEDSDDDESGEDDSEEDEDDSGESGSEMDEGSELDGPAEEWILDAGDDDDDAEDQALDFVAGGGGEDGEEEWAGELPDVLRDTRVLGENIDDLDPDEEEVEEDFDDEADSFDEHYDHDELAHLELAEAANVDPGPEDRFGATWAWARAPPGSGARGGPGGVLAPSLFHGGGVGGVLPPPRRNTRLLDYEASFMASMAGHMRARGGAEDLVSHPLLVDTSRTQSGPRSGHDRGHAHDWSHHGANGTWAHSLEQLMASANHGEGAEMQALMNLLSSHGPRDVGPEGVQISLAQNGQGQPVITMAGGARAHSPDLAMPRGALPPARPADGSSSAATRVDPVAAVQEFSPMPTSTRWSEAARIVHGPAVVERAARLRPHTINALLPGLRRAQADAKAKKDAQLAEEAARVEQERAQRVQAEKEALEREAAAQQAAEQSAAAEQENAADADAEERELEAEAIALSQQQLSEDIEMADEAGDDTGDSSQQPNLELDSLQRSLGELDRSVVGTEEADRSAAPAGESSSAAAGASEDAAPAAPARITTTVNGREVDITDTGIDPEFLEALPDDMREEVLNQHFRERQASSTVAAADSNIAPEFLNALPPELRAEVIQQEAAEARRQQGGAAAERSEARPADAAREGAAAHGALAGMLDRLRRVGARGDENEMLEGLPYSVVDDVLARRQQRHAGANGRRGAGAAGAPPGGEAVAPQKTRDAIQVLDKAGVATLVRLLFFPQMNSRATGLHKVLANLQENAKTRAELLNLLLLVLADGTSDTNAVDKSYATMTARASKGSMLANAAVTPSRPTPRRHNSTPGGLQLATPAAPSMAPISRTGDEAPFLIASRTIDALLHLTAHNEQAALYFLRDDPRASKKLKGKERSSAPVNALLALLAKPAILSNAQLVESLIALLKTVTEPLNALAAAKPAAEGAAAERTQPGEAATEAAASTSETAPAAAAEAGPSDAPAPAADAAESGALTAAPAIPAERIAAVVRPLATAISAKGFQHTLAVASNLTTVPGGRDTVSDALRREAESAGRTLVAELDALLATLPEPPKLADQEDEAKAGGAAAAAADAAAHARIHSPALTAMASPASAQTVLLRSLRALDWVVTRPQPGASLSS